MKQNIWVLVWVLIWGLFEYIFVYLIFHSTQPSISTRSTVLLSQGVNVDQITISGDYLTNDGGDRGEQSQEGEEPEGAGEGKPAKSGEYYPA